MYTKLGHTIGISNSDFNYVTCSECAANMYYKGLGCQNCGDLIEGCSICDTNGNHCNTC